MNTRALVLPAARPTPLNTQVRSTVVAPRIRGPAYQAAEDVVRDVLARYANWSIYPH